jgi:hypothetical protein
LSKGERPYFLPKSIKVNCSYGKPYHFWMAAHLSYLAQQSGYPRMTSAYTNFLFGVAYEVLWRSPDAQLERDAFHPANNQARMDLFFRSTGSFFGAYVTRGTTSGRYSRALYQSYKKSNPVPKEFLDWILQQAKQPDAKKIIEWWSMIRPDAPLPKISRTMSR